MICGAFPDETKFNNEHVIPKWILRRFNLYNRSINLPNGTSIRYDQYTVPCCADCNTFLGATFEKPIQQLVDKDPSEIENYVKSNGPWLIFLWIALIFLKTHLKDRTLRTSLDHRGADGSLADLYEWENMHHIHCIVRSSYVGCSLDPGILGSFFILPVNTKFWGEAFDYRDLYVSKTILLRLREVCFIAVLNDSCAAWNVFSQSSYLPFKLGTHIQFREIMAHLATLNLRLKKRPIFRSEFDLLHGQYKIIADLPQSLEIDDPDPKFFGKIFYACCEDILSQGQNSSLDQMKNDILEGKVTFLTTGT